MDEVKVVVAHSERATLRVGDVFLKVDADQARIDVEVEAMALAPVPTPEVLPPAPASITDSGSTIGSGFGELRASQSVQLSPAGT